MPPVLLRVDDAAIALQPHDWSISARPGLPDEERSTPTFALLVVDLKPPFVPARLQRQTADVDGRCMIDGRSADESRRASDFEVHLHLQRLRSERSRHIYSVGPIGRQKVQRQVVWRVGLIPTDLEHDDDGVILDRRARDTPSEPEGVDLPAGVGLGEVGKEDVSFHNPSACQCARPTCAPGALQASLLHRPATQNRALSPLRRSTRTRPQAS